MEARKFNTEMPILHETWAARVLNMKRNPNPGPDLINSDKIVEIKFTLVGPTLKENRYPKSWTVLEHQMDYTNNGLRGYWGLGIYEMAFPIREIPIDQLDNLEALVRNRKLWITEWKWMNQYPPSVTGGQTAFSRWENTFRYPKFKDLPPITKSYDVAKGRINLTRRVKKEDFEFLETGIPF
jgi:hypothetical protein